MEHLQNIFFNSAKYISGHILRISQRGKLQRKSKIKEVKFGVEMLLLNMDTVPRLSVESVLAHRDLASAARGYLVQRRNISISGECIVGREAENWTFYPQEVVSFVNRGV